MVFEPLNFAVHTSRTSRTSRTADFKTLLRLCLIRDLPAACNLVTADTLVTSPLFLDTNYHRYIPDY